MPMSLELLWVPGGIVVAIIGGLLTIIGVAVQKRKPRVDRQTVIIEALNGVIEQLQEERDKADELRREAIAKGDEAAVRYEGRIRALERRIRILEDYVNQLRAHIANRKGPPAPAWPKEMNGDQ
jgi:type II secretory pathway pseudopilin PulG